MSRRSLTLAIATLLLPAPLFAAFHLIKVTEAFAGTSATPNAQYVELQMYGPNESFVAGHSVIVYNAAGSMVQSFTFSSSVPNGTPQSRILIATTEAQTLFGVTADLTMSAVVPLAGGKVCWDSLDCVAWGNYTGSPTGVGAPFNPSGGIPRGQAIHRRLDIAGSPTLLEEADDTDSSANDFVLGAPSPGNNAGITGSLAQRTFVSAAGGNDANPCSRSAPCRQFAAAIARTSVGGEVIVLDSGGYGAVTIGQAVSLISPDGVYAGITAFSGDGITVNAASIDTVVLRGLTLNGLGGEDGIQYGAGSILYVENVVVSGFSGNGIAFDGTGDLSVKNGTIQNNGTNGILIQTSTGNARALIDHCRIAGNALDGVHIGDRARVAIRGSQITGNDDGIEAAPGASTTAELAVENCALVDNVASGMVVGGAPGTCTGSISNSVIATNGVHGVLAGSNGTVRVSSSTVTRNDVGLTQSGSGVLESAGNNTVRGNKTAQTSGTVTSFSPM